MTTEPFSFNSRELTSVKSQMGYFLWKDRPHPPCLNMAFDEQCFNDCGCNDALILRFYNWDRPSVSIGYFQCFDSVSSDFYSIVRRPTGGGIVFHDHGITYSLSIPSSHWLYQGSRSESYRTISEAIINCLSRFGIEGSLNGDTPPLSFTNRHSQKCFSSPSKFDVLAKGEKVAGAAQKRNTKALLHQGYINLKRLTQVDPKYLTSSLVVEFESLFACTMAIYTPGKDFFSSASLRVQEKFNTEKWIRKR